MKVLELFSLSVEENRKIAVVNLAAANTFEEILVERYSAEFEK